MANAPMDPGTPPPAHSDIAAAVLFLAYVTYVSCVGLVERCHKGVRLVILKATKGPWLKKGQLRATSADNLPNDSSSRYVPKPHTAMVSKAILVTQVS